jgi:hypothetical protein
VPLPGGGKLWFPARVLLGGSPSAARRGSEGNLWISLPAGAHEIILEGPLPEADSIPIPLPLQPRRVEASVTGWTLHGLRQDGLADESLQLVRLRSSSSEGKARLQPGELPPFLSVERTLHLGLTWQVHTRVSRLTPPGAAINLEIPLLEGESVTTPDLSVSKGKLRLALGPQAMEAAWSSVFMERDSINLEAFPGPWTETWRLDSWPVWHVEAGGIPSVLREPVEGTRMREWRPWPGERVGLAITRPEGVPGQTLTIDQADLSLNPGLRASDASLSMSLRSSRGAQLPLVLPEGAQLQSVLVDGQVQGVRQEGRRVILEVSPGRRSAQIAWRESRGIRAWMATPVAGLGAPAVNASLAVSMPADRWILWTQGPRLGPAVLFWAVLAVFLMLSFGLGRLVSAPLAWKQWFLLSLGLTQIPVWSAVIVVLWFAALARRKARPQERVGAFNAVQMTLVVLTAVVFAVLFRAITRGLLGLPDMQISGNGSTAQMLRWYQDRSGENLPQAWVLSVPLFVYRMFMLVWALWLANAMPGWLKWAWTCFSERGFWKSGGPNFRSMLGRPPGAQP